MMANAQQARVPEAGEDCVRFDSFAHAGSEAAAAEENDRAFHVTIQEIIKSQRLEALGRISGRVAHDANNMLMIIDGYCDLLLQGPPSDARQRKYAEQIKRATEKFSGLTGQLLAFSRERSSELQVLDLNDVLRGMGEMLRHLLGRGIELMIQTGAPEALLKAPRNQIEQVILNMTLSVFDAMPHALSMRLETFTAQIDDDKRLSPGWYVGLQVTGQGGDSQDPPLLPCASAERKRGLSLGLATAAGIAQQAGGDMRVADGEGSITALFSLAPARMEHSTPEAQLLSPENKDTDASKLLNL
jgi:C4-dicarboxylate-specific signal transduction histidine kinase